MKPSRPSRSGWLLSLVLGCAAFGSTGIVLPDVADAQVDCGGDLNTAATNLRTVYDASAGTCTITENGSNSVDNGDLTFQFSGGQVAGLRGTGGGNTSTGLATCSFGDATPAGACFLNVTALTQNTPQTTVFDWDSSGAAIPVGTANLRMLVTYTYDGTNMTISSASVVTIATAQPEIEILGNGQVIQDRNSPAQLADHTQFVDTDVGSTSTRTFTIRNIGTANLTGVAASLRGGGPISIQASPDATVAPGASTTVILEFTPTFEGNWSNHLDIASNDADENPTGFPVLGPATNGTADFDVREQGGSSSLIIANNDTSPRAADGTDFGTVDVAAGTQSSSFRLFPTGSATVTFTGTPRVQVTGAHAADFTVTAQAPAIIGLASGLFTIEFNPSGGGLRQATVEIPSSVAGKNPYTFAIQGTGTGVTTGQVTFVAQVSGGDTTINLASPTAALAVSLVTVNGQAQQTVANVATGSHTVTLPDLTGLGFGWTGIACDDGDSTVDLAQLTLTLQLSVGEDLTCTIALVETRAATSQMIANFLGARNSQILAHQPDMARCWSRLSGGGGAGSSLTTSVLGFIHSFAFPLQVAVSENSLSYAATWSGMTGQADSTADAGTWDIWSEGRIARFDDSTSDDGLFAIVHGGVDYRAGENLLLGFSASIDWSEQSNTANAGEISGVGWMVGPFAMMRVSERVFVDLRAAWGRSDNEVSPFGTYTDSFDTTRWLVTGSIGGDYAYGAWRLSPVLSMQYIEERQDAYTDSLNVLIPGQTIAQGDVRFQPRLAYTHLLADGTRVTPWAEVSGVYTFAQRGSFSTGSLAADLKGLTSSLRSGVDIAMPGGGAMSLAGQYDGLGSGGAHSYGGSLRLSFPLN